MLRSSMTVMASPRLTGLAGEAGREPEHCLLPARTGEFAGIQCADCGFPVDAGEFDSRVGDAGTDVNEAGEVLAVEPCGVGDAQPGGGFESVDAVSNCAKRRWSHEAVMSPSLNFDLHGGADDFPGCRHRRRRRGRRAMRK